MEESAPESSHKQRTRSPGYPAFPLGEALKKAQAMFEKEKRNFTPYAAAVAHWKLKPTSSSALTAVATLKKFGLLHEKGGGSTRQVALTDLAFNILLDKRDPSPERDRALKEAALTPKLYQDLWRKWSGDLPSDQNIEYHLVHDLKFNDDVVKGTIADFRETLSFAKLTKDDIIDQEDEVQNQPRPDGPEAAGPWWPFKTTADQQKQSGQTHPKLDLQMPSGTKQDVFTLDEGQVVLQWPSTLGEASFADLKDWMELARRKIGRSVKGRQQNQPPANEDSGSS